MTGDGCQVAFPPNVRGEAVVRGLRAWNQVP